jgi:hypothetical protein
VLGATQAAGYRLQSRVGALFRGADTTLFSPVQSWPSHRRWALDGAAQASPSQTRPLHTLVPLPLLSSPTPLPSYVRSLDPIKRIPTTSGLRASLKALEPLPLPSPPRRTDGTARSSCQPQRIHPSACNLSPRATTPGTTSTLSSQLLPLWVTSLDGCARSCFPAFSPQDCLIQDAAGLCTTLAVCARVNHLQTSRRRRQRRAISFDPSDSRWRRVTQKQSDAHAGP